MNMPFTIPNPHQVRVRHERRRKAEFKAFLKTGQMHETHVCENGKRIVIRHVETMGDGKRLVVLAFMGSTKTWQVWA